MSSKPLIRACIFSSVNPLCEPAKNGASAVKISSFTPDIEIVSILHPRFPTKFSASSSDSVEVKTDGNLIQRTLSYPNASTAMVATRAESIPPDNPTNTLEKPDLIT